MSIASILVTFEDATYTTYKDTYVDYPWMHVYGRERFWHLIYSVPGETEMKKTLELARQRRAGWVYVTDDGPDGNPPDGSLGSSGRGSAPNRGKIIDRDFGTTV